MIKVIEKIKEIINKIFKKDKLKLIEEHKEIEKIDVKTKIFGTEMVGKTNEKIRLLNMQKKFESKEIKEENINLYDVDKLKLLYCKQIIELNNIIKMYSKN